MPPANTEIRGHAKPLSSGLVLLVATNFGNLVNFLFLVLMCHLLSTDELRVMNLMLGIFGLFAVPAIALQLAIARQTAILAEQGDTDSVAAILIRATRRLGMVCAWVIVGLLVLSPWLKGFLHLDHYTPILVTVAMIVTMLVLQAGIGALQGMKRFGWLSLVNAGTPLVRIALGGLAVWAGWKASGALLGTLAGNLVMILLCAAAFADHLGRKISFREFDTGVVYRYLGPTLVSLIAYAVLANVDLLVVGHYNSYFTPDQAGQYSVANRFGQAIGWLISPLCTVLFPHVWDESQDESHRGLLLKFLLTAVGIGVAAAFACSLASGILTRFLLGHADATVTWLIPRYVWAMLPIGVANVLLNFVMARGRYAFLTSFVILVALYLGAFAVWHATFGQVLTVVAAFGVITLALFVVVTYRMPKAPQTP